MDDVIGVLGTMKQHMNEVVGRLRTLMQHPRVVRAQQLYNTYMPVVMRVLVCLYFVNGAITSWTYWWYYNVPGALCALLN